MKKHAWISGVLLWAVGLSAQGGKAPDSVVEVNVSLVKPGMTMQWEAGRKRHSDFHRAQKDTWPVLVYQVASGDSYGNYISIQPGHTWKDFDKRASFDKLDVADVMKNLDPYETTGPRGFYVFRPDLSRGKEGANPTKMMTVTHYWLHPEHVRDFEEAVKALNGMIDKASYPSKPGRWYQLANGGDVPHFVLVTDRNSWADMEPPAQTMADALGPDGVQALTKLRSATKRINTEIVEYRQDLSFIPAK